MTDRPTLENLDVAPEPDGSELTVEEARDLVSDLSTDLYWAQDRLGFVGECCDTADREQRTITTADVREWLKGARCGRQLAADAAAAAEAPEPDDVDKHVCKPGASVYYCPTGGETESDCHGGFDVCCARPDLHQPLLPCSSARFQQQPHAPHDWEPQPGMDPVHCPGYGDPTAVDRLTDAHQVTIGQLRAAEARVQVLEAALERVRGLPLYDRPVHGDTSRGVQMGWDRARQAALDAIDEPAAPPVADATGAGSDGGPRHRLAALRQQWAAEGPPPGVSRWWDQRLAELDAVLEETP